MNKHRRDEHSIGRTFKKAYESVHHLTEITSTLSSIFGIHISLTDIGFLHDSSLIPPEKQKIVSQLRQYAEVTGYLVKIRRALDTTRHARHIGEHYNL